MTPDIYIKIGEIINARTTVLYVKKKYKEQFSNAQKDFEIAKSDFNNYGMFEDCGPSYSTNYEIAKSKLAASNEAIETVISFEKYYKKLKHQFKEKYPEQEVLLQTYINNQTQEIQNKYHEESKEIKLNKKKHKVKV